MATEVLSSPAEDRASSSKSVPLSRRELLIVGFLLLLAGAALFGSHVADGNFGSDDWALASLVKYTGYWSVVSFYLHIDHRPLVALYLPLVELLSSENIRVQLAWIALARVGLCFSLYVCARTLSIGRVEAVALTALALLFPFSDSGWMYVVGSPGSISVSLYLLGVVAAVHGLRAQGRRAGWLHALAVALYVASVLMYELALIPICLTGALYMLYAPRRKAAVRWAVDLAWMALTVVLVTSRTVPLLPGADVHSRLSRSQELTHAKLIYQQGRDLVAASMQPFGSLHYNRVLAVCAAVFVVSVLIWARLPRSDWARLRLQRWLVVAAAAIVGLIASWALFVPTDFYYSPEQAGIGNRINVMAGLFICVLAVALAMLLSTSVVRVMRRRELWATIGALALIAVIGVGYGRRVESDKAAWAVASKRQTRELAVIHFAVPDPRPGTEIVLFDAPGYAAPGVPIFAAPWDLNGAVQLSYDNYTLTAYPALVTALPVCGPTKVIPPGTGYSAQQLAVAYGKTLFVNAQTGAVIRIRSRDQCQAALTRFPAGPALPSG